MADGRGGKMLRADGESSISVAARQLVHSSRRVTLRRSVAGSRGDTLLTANTTSGSCTCASPAHRSTMLN